MDGSNTKGRWMEAKQKAGWSENQQVTESNLVERGRKTQVRKQHRCKSNMEGTGRSTQTTKSNTECRGERSTQGRHWKTHALSWSA